MTTEITAEQLKEYVLFQFESLENILRIAHNDKLAMVIEYIAYDYSRGNTDCEPPDSWEDKIMAVDRIIFRKTHTTQNQLY